MPIDNEKVLCFDHLTHEERMAHAMALPFEEEWAQGLVLGDEWANSLTHGIGFLLSFIGLIILFTEAFEDGDFWKMISYGIYGLTLMLLYAASTLYHAVKRPRLKKFFRTVDHCAIYLLIAGTYTPFTLLVLEESWGMALFSVVWGLAGMGIVYKLFFAHRFKAFSTALYLSMGWMAVIAIEPFMNSIPYEGLCWIVAGGISYTGGVVFYLMDKRRFYHAIWHLFVMGGSICHYLAVLFYI